MITNRYPPKIRLVCPVLRLTSMLEENPECNFDLLTDGNGQLISLFMRILNGLFMNLRVISRASRGMVADKRLQPKIYHTSAFRQSKNQSDKDTNTETHKHMHPDTQTHSLSPKLAPTHTDIHTKTHTHT
jgi:hypothetical protein